MTRRQFAGLRRLFGVPGADIEAKAKDSEVTSFLGRAVLHRLVISRHAIQNGRNNM